MAVLSESHPAHVWIRTTYGHIDGPSTFVAFRRFLQSVANEPGPNFALLFGPKILSQKIRSKLPFRTGFKRIENDVHVASLEFYVDALLQSLNQLRLFDVHLSRDQNVLDQKTAPKYREQNKVKIKGTSRDHSGSIVRTQISR